MRIILSFAILAVLLTDCSSAPPSPILAPTCGPTPVMESDLRSLGFEPAPSKIVVFRIFATWCPFCKSDLAQISEKFKNGLWHADRVSIFLLAYRNHDEDRSSFERFLKEKLRSYEFPVGAIQIKYVDKTRDELSETKNTAQVPVFAGWRGLPFGMVFGSDGRLAYRGHFTSSDGAESTHYRFITELQKEHCSK